MNILFDIEVGSDFGRAFERLIADGFFDGVPIEKLRQIAIRLADAKLAWGQRAIFDGSPPREVRLSGNIADYEKGLSYWQTDSGFWVKIETDVRHQLVTVRITQTKPAELDDDNE
jgi:hypothetical protein